MSIEADAQKDLAMTDADAESVIGGRRAKKSAKKSTVAHRAPTHPVDYIRESGGSDPADGLETTDPDDCADSGGGLPS
jgi:hypothetical protein